MIENEKQYLITFREAAKFEHGIRRIGKLLDHIRDGKDRKYRLLEVEREGLRSQHDDLVRQLAEYDRVHAADRVGPWTPTYSGRRFWLLDPRPQDICIEDIARCLGRTSRYYGATLGEHGYSVAQHSVLASEIVGPAARLAALLHDAAEAYVGDVTTPLKKLLGDAYCKIEDRIMRAVIERFGVSTDVAVWGQVGWADRTMLATEIRDLVPLQVIYVMPEESPLPDQIVPWTQEQSERRFLKRFKELTDAGKADRGQ